MALTSTRCGRDISILMVTVAAVFAMAGPLSATTAGVCFGMANVPPRDALNMRARPSAGSHVVARFANSSEVILASLGPCGRWCRVAASTENGTQRGWINSRFLRRRECP